MGTMLRMCSPPVEGPYIPAMRVVRDAAHTGAFDHACLKSIPFAASASTFGVVA
jgi:hypothetical protein